MKKIIILLMLVGCETHRDWGNKQYDITNIQPVSGVYYMDQPGCFRVIAENALRFSEDCYRNDDINIVEGAFSWAWGTADGYSCPECSCPTDGYAISGHFTTPTFAEGSIIYGACNYNFPLTQTPFTATIYQYDQPDAGP
jgi:hypothetical protein